MKILLKWLMALKKWASDNKRKQECERQLNNMSNDLWV